MGLTEEQIAAIERKGRDLQQSQHAWADGDQLVGLVSDVRELRDCDATWRARWEQMQERAEAAERVVRAARALIERIHYDGAADAFAVTCDPGTGSDVDAVDDARAALARYDGK